jgi:integrase
MNVVQPIRSKGDLDAIRKVLLDHPRDYCLFVLGINSGLRISDLLKLRVGDVFERKPRSRRVLEYVELREKKTGKTKRFPLNASARSALRWYLNERKCAADDPLFPSRKGDAAIGRSQAYRVLTNAARRAGVNERIGTHTLRKTFGYHVYQQSNHDLPLIQKLLNHRSQDSTLRYLGILQDDLDAVFNRLNI